MCYFNDCHCCADTFCHTSQMISKGYSTSVVAPGGNLGHGAIRFICEGQSRSVSLQKVWMVASCFKLISVNSWGCVSQAWRAPVDGICVHCATHTADRTLHGFCSIDSGAADVVVLGATAVGSFTSWVGADVDAAGATSPMMDVSGLTASGLHSQMWWQACMYCPPPMTWTRQEPLLALQMMVAGATGSLCHWGQIWFGWQRMEVSCGSLTGHGTLCSGQHIGWGGHILHQHVGQWAWSIMAHWCIVLTGMAFLQVNTSEHRLVCYGMLAQLSTGLDQSTWHGWAILWQSSQLLQLDHWF